MHPKLKRVILLAMGLVCVLAWLLIPALRRSAATRKYPVGMAIQEVRKMVREPYYIYTNTDPRQPWHYLLRANKDGLVMTFGPDEKLIAVVLLTDYK